MGSRSGLTLRITGRTMAVEAPRTYADVNAVVATEDVRLQARRQRHSLVGEPLTDLGGPDGALPRIPGAETEVARARLAAIPTDRIVNCWPQRAQGAAREAADSVRDVASAACRIRHPPPPQYHVSSLDLFRFA